MEINADQLIANAIRDSLASGVKSLCDGYKSPLEPTITAAVEAQRASLRKILDDALSACIGSDDFREQVRVAVKEKTAKVLIDKFGGEVEKQVNQLKSDPATRARITLAIEEIVASK